MTIIDYEAGTLKDMGKASAKVVTRVSAALGVVAAVLTSGLATMILSIAPHASDLWGLRAVAALLRIIFLAGVLLRTWLHRHEAAIGDACRLATSSVVEANALLPQPLFTTIAGGTFKLGEPAHAATLRLGRSAWAGVAAADTWLTADALPLIVALVVLLLPRLCRRALGCR